MYCNVYTDKCIKVKVTFNPLSKLATKGKHPKISLNLMLAVINLS